MRISRSRVNTGNEESAANAQDNCAGVSASGLVRRTHTSSDAELDLGESTRVIGSTKRESGGKDAPRALLCRSSRRVGCMHNMSESVRLDCTTATFASACDGLQS